MVMACIRTVRPMWMRVNCVLSPLVPRNSPGSLHKSWHRLLSKSSRVCSFQDGRLEAMYQEFISEFEDYSSRPQRSLVLTNCEMVLRNQPVVTRYQCRNSIFRNQLWKLYDALLFRQQKKRLLKTMADDKDFDVNEFVGAAGQTIDIVSRCIRQKDFQTLRNSGLLVEPAIRVVQGHMYLLHRDDLKFITPTCKHPGSMRRTRTESSYWKTKDGEICDRMGDLKDGGRYAFIAVSAECEPVLTPRQQEIQAELLGDSAPEGSEEAYFTHFLKGRRVFCTYWFHKYYSAGHEKGNWSVYTLNYFFETEIEELKEEHQK